MLSQAVSFAQEFSTSTGLAMLWEPVATLLILRTRVFLRWVGTKDVIEKEKFSESASCPSETCLPEAEVAQPAFCPVWKLTCQSITKDQTWKDPALPQVGLNTQ